MWVKKKYSVFSSPYFWENDRIYVITIVITNFDTLINLSIGRDDVTCVQIGTEHAGNQKGETKILHELFLEFMYNTFRFFK